VPPFVEPYYEVSYELTGSTLDIAGTPLKAGDGSFVLGPGRMVLQIDASGVAGGLVRLQQLRIEQRFRAGDVVTELELELTSPVAGLFDGTSRVEWVGDDPEFRVAGIVTCNLRTDFCALGDLKRGENRVDRVWREPLGPLQFRLKPGRRYQFGMDWETSVDEGAVTTWLRLRGTEFERKLVELALPEA
jgi:hypothetical protein